MEIIDSDREQTYEVAKRIALSIRLGTIRAQIYKLIVQERECIEAIIATNELIRGQGLDISVYREYQLAQVEEQRTA
ncbi:MAG: hypothetical protein ACREGF_03345 [Candidatus Saccharimonadales bacterium]